MRLAPRRVAYGVATFDQTESDAVMAQLQVPTD